MCAVAMAVSPFDPNRLVDFGSVYAESPMLVVKTTYSEREQRSVKLFLGSFVLFDVLPWLGGRIRKPPHVACESLLPLATTGQLWNVFVRGVNLNLRSTVNQSHFAPLFASPRLLTISFTSPVAHIMPFKGPLDWSDLSDPQRFGAPCPFECESYTRPIHVPSPRCESGCCTGNLFVHPSPRMYHVALRKLQLAKMSKVASIVPRELTDPECGSFVQLHRGLHPLQIKARPPPPPPPPAVASSVLQSLPGSSQDHLISPTQPMFFPQECAKQYPFFPLWAPPPPPPPFPPPPPIRVHVWSAPLSQDPIVSPTQPKVMPKRKRTRK